MYIVLNFVEVFSYLSVILVVISCITKINPIWGTYVPDVISYGKLRNNYGKFEISKAYFKHFYIVAIVTSTTLFFLMNAVYFLKSDPPEWLLYILQKFFWNRANSIMPVKNTVIGITLYTIQCFKRFYETHFVSIFSKKAKVTVFQYIGGILFYPFSFIGILSGAPKFVIGANNSNTEAFNIGYSDIVIISIFLCSSWIQYKSTVILANLRRNSKEKESNAYKIPAGGPFTYISSPHMTTEIMIYLCLLSYFWNNATWFSVFLLVLSNQMYSIYETHEWYETTFKNYPLQRKIFFPFIY